MIALSNQHSAFSQSTFTATDAKEAKRKIIVFLATIAPFVVKFMG
jgi:hypothetical protein